MEKKRKSKVNNRNKRTTNSKSSNSNISKINNNLKNKNNTRKDKLSTKSFSVKISNNKIVTMFIIILILFIIILIRLGQLQLVEGSELAKKAANQQMVDKIISASRGNILDRNGEVLAQSLSADTISINPYILRDNNSDFDKEDFAENIAKIFELKKEDILKQVDSEISIETIATKQDKKKVDQLKKYIKEKDLIGINIDPDIKRFYPYGSLASNVIGFCGTDNVGLEGLELELNDVLMGKRGKVRTGANFYNQMLQGQNISPEDGSNVYLTIDVEVQRILEKHLNKAHKYNDNDASIAIAMNPQTSEILGMATAPTYNLNNPFKPLDITAANWNKLNFEKKQNILQKMWKNTAITDGYEPGSVFKMVTASIGLEENKATPDKPADFLCTGRQKVVDTSIACWSWYNPHGSLSLRESLQKSCNPAFMQLAARIGRETYYKYMEGFGLFDKTGVRLAGEEYGIRHNLENVGPVELAVMAFGQRFTITPLQMINAASTIANGGTLYEPQIIKKVENPKTGSTEIKEAKPIRQVLSVKTSTEMMDMLYTGCGIHARIPGYKIAGKSGTSEPQPGKEHEGYVASFCAIAPSDDPQIALLVVQKHPKGYGYVDGGSISGKVVNAMLRELLPLLGINKETDKPKIAETKLIEVPNIKNKTVNEARKTLQEKGFNPIVKTVINPTEALIIGQTPSSGIKLEKDSKIYLYTDENDTRVSVSVPDLLNKNITNAKKILKKNNLNYIINGKSGTVIKQEPKQGTAVEEGTVIKITIK